MNRRRLLEILGLAAVSGVPAYAQGEAQAPAQGRGAGGRGRGRVDPGPPITNTPQSSRDKFAGIGIRN
jgi:hypothetical protein